MMFIKFVMTGKNKDFTIDEFQAKEILSSPQQLIPVKDWHGNWTGETINKAFITCTERDRDAERTYHDEVQRLEERKKYLTAVPEQTDPEKQQKLIEERKKNEVELAARLKHLTKSMSLK